MGLISLNKVSLRYGLRTLLDEADLSVERGDRMSLIGRNGCGKTTLLKMIAGIVRPDSGTVERVKNLTSAYLPQDVPSDLTGSVFDVLASGLGLAGKAAVLTEKSRLGKLRKRSAENLKKFRAGLRSPKYGLQMLKFWKPQTGLNSIRSKIPARLRRV